MSFETGILNYRPKKQPAVLKQMYDVVELLKSDRRPFSIAEIERRVAVRVIRESELAMHLRENPRVTFDSYADTLQYRPQYNLRDRFEIRDFLRSRTGALGTGVPRPDLDDCYVGAVSDVQALLDSRDVFSLRNSENHVEVLYGNDEPTIGPVDDPIRKMWQSIALAPTLSAADLDKELALAGLRPTTVETEEAPKKRMTEAEEAEKANMRKRMQRIKVTNVHLGMEKDLAAAAAAAAGDSAPKRVKASR
jgi:hypothetical protein